jgi:hypothetical protein
MNGGIINSVTRLHLIGYSLLACDTVQFSTLTPEYWSVQHFEDCGNMYLSNVGTQNMIKKCRSLHKSVI